MCRAQSRCGGPRRECGNVCLQEAGHAGAGLGFTLPGRCGIGKDIRADVGRAKASCQKTPREVKEREEGRVSKGGGASVALTEEELGARGRRLWITYVVTST